MCKTHCLSERRCLCHHHFKSHNQPTPRSTKHPRNPSTGLIAPVSSGDFERGSPCLNSLQGNGFIPSDRYQSSTLAMKMFESFRMCGTIFSWYKSPSTAFRRPVGGLFLFCVRTNFPCRSLIWSPRTGLPGLRRGHAVETVKQRCDRPGQGGAAPRFDTECRCETREASRPR